MKKVVSVLFTTALCFGLVSPAFAAEDNDVNKGLDLIQKSNQVIDQKIVQAVEKADDLQSTYLLDIRKLEEGDKVVSLKGEKEKTLADLAAANNDINKINKLNEKLASINAKLEEEQTRIDSKINNLQQDIDDLTAQIVSLDDKDTAKIDEKISKLEQKLDEKTQKYQDRTAKFSKDLDKTITDVYNETLKISNDTIKKAADKGITAECSWTLVRFADKWVWIDPIRVVKF
jgi:DNA repair exonuclease SbcCD ATPase subunit